MLGAAFPAFLIWRSMKTTNFENEADIIEKTDPVFSVRVLKGSKDLSNLIINAEDQRVKNDTMLLETLLARLTEVVRRDNIASEVFINVVNKFKAVETQAKEKLKLVKKAEDMKTDEKVN
jgi:hypothetical protein